MADAAVHGLGNAALTRLREFADFDFGPLAADPALCLGPTDVIDCDHPAVQQLAHDLTRQCTTPLQRAQVLFAWVRDEVTYNFTPTLSERAHWRASASLERRDGFCQQKAVLLAALLRAVGIAAGLGFQHVRDHMLLDTRFEAHLPSGLILFHGCTMVHLDGVWRVADATLDRDLCRRRGYRLVELGERGDADLPATDLRNHPHFDFILRTGPYADLPKTVCDLFLRLALVWVDMKRLVEKTGATM